MAENATTLISAKARSAMKRQRVAKAGKKEIVALTIKNAILVLHADPVQNGRFKLFAWHSLMLDRSAKLSMIANPVTSAGRSKSERRRYVLRRTQHQITFRLCGMKRTILRSPRKQSMPMVRTANQEPPSKSVKWPNASASI